MKKAWNAMILSVLLTLCINTMLVYGENSNQTLSDQNYGTDAVIENTMDKTIDKTIEKTIDNSEAAEVEEYYTDESGVLYELLEIKESEVEVPERIKNVASEKTFNAIENAEAIPAQIQVTVEDSSTGQEILSNIPMTECRPLEEYWNDDFTMPVTFHNYGADYYQINGEYQIEVTDELSNLEAYGKDLLNEAGLDSENYQISEIEWNGEPYQAEDGEWCRDAVAIGSKKLVDYLVSYQGDVVLPEAMGIQKVAVYQMAAAEVPAEPELTVTPVQEEPSVIEIPVKTEEVVITEPKLSFWHILENAVTLTISIGLILIALAIIIWVIYRGRKAWMERKHLA